MSLLAFPNELIEAIARHLPDDRDVNSLVLVNRRFYALLNIYLYRRNHAVEEGAKRDALLWAIRNARMDTFLRAEALGIPIWAPSLLAQAAEHGHLHIVKFLFPRVRRERVTRLENELVIAYVNNHSDVFRYLVDNGVDLDAMGVDALTVLHFTACSGDTPNMELLLERGANIDVLDCAERTPLHYACEQREVAAVELLLEKGANFEAVDGDLDTPMHLAAWSGCLRAVELLLEKGANHSLENYHGWTPALVAIESGCENTDAVARLLIEATEG